MLETGPDRLLTVEEWELLEDPDGGRYEVLDARLVVSPSPASGHNRFGEDLADIFRFALEAEGRDDDVTIDVEWRVVEGVAVRQAPRGDVVVGRVDPDRGFHAQVPLLVVEIWEPTTRPSVKNRKRLYWAARDLRHYWEVQVGDPALIREYDFVVGPDPVQTVVDGDVLFVTEPFAVSVTPAGVVGWSARQARLAVEEALRRAEAESRAAEAESRATVAESALAAERAARAVAEARIAELEARRAARDDAGA